jgi:SAM-dependent methyltransferase
MQRLLRRIGIDQSWFGVFAAFWSDVLGKRPLWGVEDFYFLRGYFRLAFQGIALPDQGSVLEHVATYRQSDAMYFLFQQVYREKLGHAATTLGQVFPHVRRTPRAVLEYGCGTAPITTALFEFMADAPEVQFILADLAALPLYYTAYKFRRCQNVQVVPLLPADNLLLDERPEVDMVFCMTVFEHLNEPLATARIFHECLSPGGLLIFDYVKGQGDGLDTGAGVRERGEVLDFIADHFEVVEGILDRERSIGLTIARKLR